MKTPALASFAVAITTGATVVAIAQSSPEFKSLPKLQNAAPAALIPPRVVSLNRPAQAAFMPLPRI